MEPDVTATRDDDMVEQTVIVGLRDGDPHLEDRLVRRDKYASNEVVSLAIYLLRSTPTGMEDMRAQKDAWAFLDKVTDSQLALFGLTRDDVVRREFPLSAERDGARQ